MPENLCRKLEAFLANPTARRDEFQAGVRNMLVHLESCEDCVRLLDSPDSLELFGKAVLDAEMAILSSQSAGIDQMADLDQGNEESVRVAIRDILIPSLDKRDQVIAKCHDPILLFGALEAVSTLLFRHVAGDNPESHLIQLASDASVYVNDLTKPAIPSAGIALEIARFTDLWDYAAGNARRPTGPSKEAKELALWVVRASRVQRSLLRHFRVDRPWIQGDRVTLLLLRADEQTMDLSKRWAPEPAELETVCIVDLRSGSPDVVDGVRTPADMYSIPMSLLQHHRADVLRAFSICSPSENLLGRFARHSTAFLCGEALIQKLKRLDRTKSHLRKLELTENVHVRAEFLGRVSEVSFEDRTVRIRSSGVAGPDRIVEESGERITFLSVPKAIAE